MSAGTKLKKELQKLSLAMLYFGAWIGGLVALKSLVLAEYDIEFRQWSAILVGSLVLAKVVLILEHVPLGAWTRSRPAYVDVFARTLLYSLGVFVVLLLEKSFEGRQEAGGFGAALAGLFRDVDMPHVWANTICLSGALFGYNALAVVRRHLGDGGLVRIFLEPLPEQPEESTEAQDGESD